MGDCRDQLKTIEDDSVDLIFTSPPYADRRKDCYDSISVDDYIDWFLPIGEEIKRVMKPTGSFFLNLKAHTENGERSLYVMELVIALKRQTGFNFVDEFCWTKNPFPGGFKGRFKNAFEPVYHFTKGNLSDITFNPLACGTKPSPDTISRANRKQCGVVENGSGMNAVNLDNLKKIKLARPSNVIHVNNVSNQFGDKNKHPATFPEGLVEFFIKSFTNENDIVLDPFSGSGTTGLVAKKLNRQFIGIEINKDYYDLSSDRIHAFTTLANLVNKKESES